jgi:inositol transport system permease protein
VGEDRRAHPLAGLREPAVGAFAVPQRHLDPGHVLLDRLRLLAGLSGLVLSSRIGSGQPGLGLGYELDAIASAVIGGTSLSGGIGTIWGTIVGALIIGVLNNGLDLLNVSAYWQTIVKGSIIVVAVIIDERKNR